MHSSLSTLPHSSVDLVNLITLVLVMRKGNDQKHVTITGVVIMELFEYIGLERWLSG